MAVDPNRQQDEERKEVESVVDWNLFGGELYGRKEQIKALKFAYTRRRKRNTNTSENNPEFVLITGVSGSGKSVLARTIRQRVEDDWGFYISGKFDNHNQAPLAPFIHAVEEFVRQARLRGDHVVEKLRNAIRESIGPEVFVLLEVIPILEEILEINNSSLANLDILDEASMSSDSEFKMENLGENHMRFTSVFCRFIRAICSPERPIVFLLDDIQWCDHASLQIFSTLLDPSAEDVECLMLVGTCRGNEVALGDELSVMLRDIEDRGTKITDIQVTALSVTDLSNMISNALNLPVAACVSLAEIVQTQTYGNAFFAKEYIRHLSERGLLYKDCHGKWLWDEAALLQALPSVESNAESVIQLLARKMQQLPNEVVETLKVISCLGSKFTEGILFHTSLVSSQVLSALGTAAEHGFIYYDVNHGTGKFPHDKFREAAYSLIPEEERNMFHLSIGRNLRRQLSTAQVKAKIVLIVNQLKHGLAYVDDPDERDDFARLFLLASRQVASRAAFVSALEYIDLGIGLLNRRHWRDQYELSLDLFSTGAELGYCTGLPKKVDELASEVVANAWTIEDQIRVTMVQINSVGGHGKIDDALTICFGMLKKLKEPFPKKPRLRILWELFLTKRALRDKTEEDILALPKMTNRRVVSSIKLIYIMFPLLAMADLKASVLIPLRIVRLTLKHGSSPLAAIGFILYSVGLVRLGEYSEACRWADLANVILERYQSRQLQAKVKYVYWAIICVIREPIRKTLKPMWDAHRIGIKTGDLEISMAACVFHGIFRLFLGDPLTEVSKSLSKSEELCGTYKQLKIRIMSTLALQLVDNLQGKVKNNLSLTGQYFDEQNMVKEMETQNLKTIVVIVMYFKFLLAAILNENEFADRLVREHKTDFDGFLVPFLTVQKRFYHGLVCAALARESAGRARRKHIADSRKNQEELKKLLIHCPGNVINKICLIDAELEFGRGRYSTALLHYRKAVSCAEQAGFITEQAIACEKAGLCLQHADRKGEATEYLRQALSLYVSYGAEAKVEQVNKRLIQIG